MPPSLLWNIFCRVIDNFGDVGVCWRLARDLAARGQRVRLWLDDASALAWMAPQGAAGVQVLPWPSAAAPDGPGDVLIEAFGCELPAVFFAPDSIAADADCTSARGQKTPKKTPVLINLEYLSAERYVERCHRLPSPVKQGSCQGWVRWFFYPGFTPATGGLLRELDLAARQAHFDRRTWRAQHGVAQQQLAVSLFCYEPAALPTLLPMLRQLDAQLLVTPGRAAAAVRTCPAPLPTLHWLQPCAQPAFDELLWACDLNLVRGEDSLVRALWAGAPLVWHIYPQDDNAHHAKLHAFLDWLQAPPSLRQFHCAWNSLAPASTLPVLDAHCLQEWRQCIQAARQRLLEQQDLLTQLLGFVAEKS